LVLEGIDGTAADVLVDLLVFLVVGELFVLILMLLVVLLACFGLQCSH